MKILIADDESIIRLGLRSMLQDMGHEVFAASDGRQALEIARHNRLDLAILDIKMPYTNGLQVAKTLGRTQPIPILLLTAYSEDDLIDKATDLPIHGYLIKPIKSEELAAAMSVAVKRFDESRVLTKQASKLAETLETRKLVDRAKGILMDKEGLSEAEAYRLLQKQARELRKSMKEVATAVLKR